MCGFAADINQQVKFNCISIGHVSTLNYFFKNKLLNVIKLRLQFMNRYLFIITTNLTKNE